MELREFKTSYPMEEGTYVPASDNRKDTLQ